MEILIVLAIMALTSLMVIVYAVLFIGCIAFGFLASMFPYSNGYKKTIK